jgi:hypothetical protein
MFNLAPFVGAAVQNFERRNVIQINNPTMWQIVTDEFMFLLSLNVHMCMLYLPLYVLNGFVELIITKVPTQLVLAILKLNGL